MYLSTTTDTTIEATEGHALFLVNDVLKVSDGTTQMHVLNVVSGLTGVFEVNTEVRTPGHSR